MVAYEPLRVGVATWPRSCACSAPGLPDSARAGQQCRLPAQGVCFGGRAHVQGRAPVGQDTSPNAQFGGLCCRVPGRHLDRRDTCAAEFTVWPKRARAHHRTLRTNSAPSVRKFRGGSGHRRAFASRSPPRRGIGGPARLEQRIDRRVDCGPGAVRQGARRSGIHCFHIWHDRQAERSHSCPSVAGCARRQQSCPRPAPAR